MHLMLADDVFGYPAGTPVAVEYQHGVIHGVRRLTAAETAEITAQYGARLLDCRGLLVLPGLIDAHVHAIATGMTMLGVHLNACASLDELAQAIAVAQLSSPDFVRLSGLDLSRLVLKPGEQLNRAWLDGQLSGQPLIIKSVEGHSSWFNTRAWTRLDINEVLAKVGAAEAEQSRMWASGRVFGAAYEELTTPVYDSFSDAERRAGMQRVLQRAAQVGLTGIHCLEGYGERRRGDFQLILDLSGQGCDLTLYCRGDSPALASEMAQTRFGGCFLIDGAIGAYTAALSVPYADRPESHGELYNTDEELSAWIESGLRLGMQVCVHAIGDRALDQVIRVYEGLAGRYDLQRLRPRVDHFVLGTPELARRACAIGLVSAMQPAFDAFWGGESGGYATRLGPARALNANPVGAMQAAGLRVAGSSDSYITPLDPLGGMRAALRHHNPAQRVDFDAAVRLFTADASYLAQQETTRGRIAPGYQADFTVVRGDRTLADDARVALTIKSGQVIYRQAAASAG